MTRRFVAGIIAVGLASSCRQSHLQDKATCYRIGWQYLRTAASENAQFPATNIAERPIIAYNEKADTCLCQYEVIVGDSDASKASTRVGVIVDVLANRVIASSSANGDAKAAERYRQAVRAMTENSALPAGYVEGTVR